MYLNAKSHTLKIDGTEMDYVCFGKGTKPLVLLPGLSLKGVKGSAVLLAYMYRLFAREFRCFVFDRKAALPQDCTVRELARDTACAMDTLGISDADIFGVSQGGMLAQYLAIDYPYLVHKLVLAVTLSRENETVRTVVGNWIRLSEQDDYGTLIRDLFEKMYSEKYIKKYRPLIPLLAKIGKPKDMGRFITLAKACLTCNAYDELDKIKQPVFVMGGSLDKVVTGEASEEIARKLRCDIFMYGESGHAAYEEEKDFNVKVLNFLNI